MDHRYGQRRPASVPATIVRKDGDRNPARICNFSISGLYLDLLEREQRPFEAVEIELDGLHDKKSHRIDGHVVRVDEYGVAVMMDDSLTKSLLMYNLLREYVRNSSMSATGEDSRPAMSLNEAPGADDHTGLPDNLESSEESLEFMVDYIRNKRIKRNS